MPSRHPYRHDRHPIGGMRVKWNAGPRRGPPTIWIVTEDHLVLVRSGVSEQRWPLATTRRGRDWLLRLTSPDGRSWTAEGPDLFKALRA